MKNLQRTALLAFTLFMAGCAGTIQSGSITEAYKKYDDQNYAKTLELITLAENIKATTPEMKAELTYLKAQTYDNLGEHELATTLFRYLATEHRDSQYGYLAERKLDARL